MINVLLVFVWFIGITIIPGLSMLSILYKDLKGFESIELFVLAIGIGISYLVIICYLLDSFLIINLVTLIISILPFPSLIILIYHKKIFHSLKNIRNNLKNDALIKYLTIKSKLVKVKVSTALLLLVLCFIVLIELRDLLSNIVLPVNDPWFWLLESKKIALNGHLTTKRYFGTLPRGAAYFLALMFLPNLANPYFIILFIGPFFSLLQCLAVYVASKKLLNSGNLAIYAVLLYGTSRLVIWRGKIYTSENIGFFLIAILAIFLISQNNLKADLLGLLVLAALGLTSFSSLGPIMLPTLLYIIVFKSPKISIITIAGLIGGIIFQPKAAQFIWRIVSETTLGLFTPLNRLFYDNAQWSFGYSLILAFVSVAYYLKNRSSKHMFYVICFLGIFIMINFISLQFDWMNTRIFAVFSIFASTLSAQGLQATMENFKKVLTPLSKKINIRWFYLIHFVIAICIIYQIFFGMARGYHATIARKHNYEEIDAALWIYDNSSEDTVILILRSDLIPYSSILYPRTIIRDYSVYNYSPSDIAVYCSQNNINFITMGMDSLAQLIGLNDHFKEVYKEANIVIFEFNSLADLPT